MASVVGQAHCCSVVSVNNKNSVQLPTFSNSTVLTVRGLGDRGRILRRDFDKMKPSASVHAPPTPHTTHLTQPPDSTRSGSGYEAQASMQWPHTASEPPRARRRRGHLYPVLLRASALLRCGHLRASHERPAKLHGQWRSRQLRHVQPASLASSSCCGTRSESVAERGYDHA